jgi:hypothetical protein
MRPNCLTLKSKGLNGQVNSILEELGVEYPPPRIPKSVELNVVRNLPAAPQSKAWSERLAQFRVDMEKRGIDTSAIAWEEIVGAPACERVRKKLSVGFQLEANLDCYDLWMVGLAALAGVLVDWLLVNVPPRAGLLGRDRQRGGVLARWVKSVEVPEDNWLAQRFKVAYDAAIPETDLGSHRLHSFGHDPLIGMFVGVFDIMRGDMTYVDSKGFVRTVSGTAEPTGDLLIAVICHIAHLLSDAWTPRGLPPPGWGLLLKLQSMRTPFGDRSVADIAKIMYRDGYDFRHLLAMGSVPAAIELALHIYFALRCYCDLEFKDDVDRQVALAAGTRRADSEKYLTMSLLANAATAALNAVRISQQGPLGFNYPQWLNFTRRLVKWLTRRLNEPSEILLRGKQANSRALLENWPIPEADEELVAIVQELD